MVDFSWTGFLETFIQFFVIMDPFVSIPAFLSVTKKFTNLDKIAAANKAIIVAAIPILLFAFAGTFIFGWFGITISDFKIAGGIILVLLGIELVLNLDFGDKDSKDPSASAIIIGVPLITGPGVITITILSVASYGILVTLFAGFLSLFLTYVLLRQAAWLQNTLGKDTLDILSRVMGLLLTAVAISFITSGIGELSSKAITNILASLK
ncbi:MarC family integral membrane protein [uncultured archaeon]|nr:MarC family integral membrane protein [uncultured archaeon]